MHGMWIYKGEKMNEEELITKLFATPKVLLLVGDTNEGKSMVLYHLFKLLQKYKFSLASYGLKVELGEEKIYSTEQLEQARDKIIFIDEVFSLFDLENRKKKEEIERTLRLVFHHNNVLVLSLLGENCKKFLSSKAHMILFKKCTLADLINGSRVKNVCLSYKGDEMGSSILSVPKDKMILWDGKDYHKLDVKYYKEFDTKLNNAPIIAPKRQTA